jgi:hypothetical protein
MVTARPLVSCLIGLAILTSGCGLASDSSADDRDPVDVELLAALQDGWPADPAMYEVDDLECVQLDNRIEIRAVLTNRSDVRWGFSPEFVAETTDGDVLAQRTEGGFLDPGQEVAIDNFYLGTDYHDPPRCTINVFHSMFLAMQDSEDMTEIYDVLDWDQ